MEKYNLLPAQLQHEGTLYSDNFFVPKAIDKQLLLAVHQQHYIAKLDACALSRSEERALGFPQSAALVQREYIITQGTVDAMGFARKWGFAANIAGGTHHAFSDRAEGFCIFNDSAVAASVALNQRWAQRIAIIDLDVHQGNGTASIFAHEPRVYTFSMHGASNYPLRKERSTQDIALADGTGDVTYLALLEEHLPGILDDFRPQMVFYQAGVDVLKTDKLGRLALTLEGCFRRDKLVLGHCYRRNIPLVAVMGGGYSEKLSTLLEAHAGLYRIARSMYD